MPSRKTDGWHSCLEVGTFGASSGELDFELRNRGWSWTAARLLKLGATPWLGSGYDFDMCTVQLFLQ